MREAVVATAAAGPSHAAVAGQTAVAGQVIPIDGNGVVDPAHSAADLTLQVPSLGPVRVVFSGGTLAAQLPPAAAGVIGAVSGGKQWVSVDVNRLAQSGYGAPLGAFGVGTTGNPAQQLGYLRAISDTTRVVGPEPIDGVPTTHYAGAVDLDKVPAADDPATKPAVDRLKAQIGSPLLPVDVWVDGGGKLRRVGQTVTVPPAPGAPGRRAHHEHHHDDPLRRRVRARRRAPARRPGRRRLVAAPALTRPGQDTVCTVHSTPR